jgi:uncharacterized phage protein (TIGR01671 family)
MREVKFRAWNTKTNKMISSEKLYSMSAFALEKGLPQDKFIVLPNEEAYPLMQYTGLKDKNGKDIFEGDIVSDVDYEESVIIGNIVFKAGAFYIEWKNFPDSLLFLSEGTCEVIGNIYQNKELFELIKDNK